MVRQLNQSRYREQLKDEFGDLHGSLIGVILHSIPIFIAVGKEINSEEDLSRLLRQTFKQQFGVNVDQEHREAFSRAIRRIRKVLDLLNKDRPTRRRGALARLQAILKHFARGF